MGASAKAGDIFAAAIGLGEAVGACIRAMKKRPRPSCLPDLYGTDAGPWRWQAKKRNIGLTVDAEEAARLDISLELFGRLAAAPELKGWNGLGLAVQAYGRRARPALEWLAACGGKHRTRLAGASGQGCLLGYGNQAGPGGGL